MSGKLMPSNIENIEKGYNTLHRIACRGFVYDSSRFKLCEQMESTRDNKCSSCSEMKGRYVYLTILALKIW